MKQQNADIRAEVLEVYSWVNLMPGPDDPTVHFTAKVMADNTYNISIDKVELLKDSTKLVLGNIEIISEDTSSSSGNDKQKLFSMKASTKLKEKLNEGLFTAYLYFVSDGKLHKFEVKNIEIERVY